MREPVGEWGWEGVDSEGWGWAAVSGSGQGGMKGRQGSVLW